jgi:adenylate cyclase
LLRDLRRNTEMVDVKQVARELGVRYVLEGSVRRAANRVRITGQLIDTTTAAHIWADRFNGALDEIFELQDQIASNVVGAVEPKLRLSEIDRAARKPTESLDACDLYLRALAQLRRYTIEGWHEAIALLRRALAIDPSYAPAAGLFAWCRVFQISSRAISDEEITEGLRLARHAIEEGRQDPDALWMGGWAIVVLAGERAAGLSAIERALALNPNSALAWDFSGWVQGFSNRPAPAIWGAPESDGINPLDPQRWMFEGGFALAHLIAGRYEEAIEWADRALHEQSRATHVLGFKAAACGLLGRVEEERERVRRFRELRVGSTVAGVKRSLGRFLSPEALAIYVEGLRKAGLPEE